MSISTVLSTPLPRSGIVLTETLGQASQEVHNLLCGGEQNIHVALVVPVKAPESKSARSGMLATSKEGAAPSQKRQRTSTALSQQVPQGDASRVSPVQTSAEHDSGASLLGKKPLDVAATDCRKMTLCGNSGAAPPTNVELWKMAAEACKSDAQISGHTFKPIASAVGSASFEHMHICCFAFECHHRSNMLARRPSFKWSVSHDCVRQEHWPGWCSIDGATTYSDVR